MNTLVTLINFPVGNAQQQNAISTEEKKIYCIIVNVLDIKYVTIMSIFNNYVYFWQKHRSEVSFSAVCHVKVLF